MVASVTSLGRSGLHDWLLQRVSALVLFAFVSAMTYFYITTPHVTYALWAQWFAQTWMKWLTLLALLSLAIHSWVGLWIITTDYIKCSKQRVVLQGIIIFSCIAIVAWGFQILWGI